MAEQIWDNGVLRDATPEEEAMIRGGLRRNAEDRHRPLTQGERFDLVLHQYIQDLTVDDQTALRMADDYPEWAPGLATVTGQRYQHKGELYRCLQGHLTQAGWAPGPGTESLWVVINEAYDGSRSDPIPYKGNLELIEGLHYTQDGTLYRCIRSSGIAAHAPLSVLATVQGGQYVAAQKGDVNEEN